MSDSFQDLIVKNQNIIHKICHLYRNTAEDREDLFQDIVYNIWKGRKSFNGQSKPGTWIYRIAINTAISGFRRRRIDLNYQQDISKISTESVDPSELDKKNQVFWAIKQLNEADRAIISMYLDGYSYEEIGEIIGITANHTGVKINRIKNKLKQHLNII